MDTVGVSMTTRSMGKYATVGDNMKIVGKFRAFFIRIRI